MTFDLGADERFWGRRLLGGGRLCTLSRLPLSTAKSKAKKDYIPVTAGGNLADCIYSSAENKKFLATRLTANSKSISLSSNASAGGIYFM